MTPNTQVDTNYPEELGNLICKDEQSHLPPIVVGIGAVVFGVGLAIGMYLFGFELLRSALVGFAISGLGVIVAYASHCNGESGKRALLLFENAVVLEKGEQPTTIKFDDLDKFQYSRKSVYVNGVYSGDTIEMNFAPKSGAKEDSIVFSASVKDENKYPFDFNHMLKLVSEGMCENLAADLADEGHVEWVNKVLISKEGINAPVKSIVSSSQQIIPWSEIKEHKVDNGTLKIKLANAKWSNVKIECKETNFYPGYFLFCQLHELHTAETAQQAPSDIQTPELISQG